MEADHELLLTDEKIVINPIKYECITVKEGSKKSIIEDKKWFQIFMDGCRSLAENIYFKKFW